MINRNKPTAKGKGFSTGSECTAIDFSCSQQQVQHFLGYEVVMESMPTEGNKLATWTRLFTP